MAIRKRLAHLFILSTPVHPIFPLTLSEHICLCKRPRYTSNSSAYTVHNLGQNTIKSMSLPAATAADSGAHSQMHNGVRTHVMSLRKRYEQCQNQSQNC